MQNILTLHPASDKRISTWAKMLRQLRAQPVVTVIVDPQDVIYVKWDDQWTSNEIHYILEEALSQLEEDINANNDNTGAITSLEFH